MLRVSVILLLAFLISSCAAPKYKLFREIKAVEDRLQDHTGFMLYDLDKTKSIIAYQADRYFTPASNTKIFTLFASLKILGDSIPALRYEYVNDTLFFWGTGDPGFLYKNVHQASRPFSFLKESISPLCFSFSNFHTTHFGRGWAWDDYKDAYSAERSPLPIYGNIFSVHMIDNTVNVYPVFFEKNLVERINEGDVLRDYHTNNFSVPTKSNGSPHTRDIPFITSPALVAELLQDTLHREVGLSTRAMSATAKTVYSIPADSLYKVMMQQSDNFIAEQLLLVCSSVLTDSLKPEITIKHVKQNFLDDLSDKPVWIDGSGLSRYNLFTPRSIVQLWEKIYRLIPRDRLFSLLATGGGNGTLKNWYKADKPYIFGKTGTLSNNHCLSGYLVTKKGRTMIFSWMNSNYATTTTEVRKSMQKVLQRIYEKY